MQLRRTAAAAAIAALGGIAVLGTAPAAQAASPSASCPTTGNIGVSISDLKGASIPQGTTRDSVITLTNNTGHDVVDFLALLGTLSKADPNNTTAVISVVEKNGTLTGVPSEPGAYFLTPYEKPVTFAKGASLSYHLRFGATAKTPLGEYAAEVIAADMNSNGPALKTGKSGAVRKLVQAAPKSGITSSVDTSCDYGFGAAPFTVTAAGSASPTATASASPTTGASPTASASTEPVSAVSSSPTPTASATSTGGALAETGGGNTTLPIALGGALVVLGAGAVVVTRRRKAARH